MMGGEFAALLDELGPGDDEIVLTREAASHNAKSLYERAGNDVAAVWLSLATQTNFWVWSV